MFRIGIGPALVIFAALGNAIFAIPMSVLAPIAAVIMSLAVCMICRDFTKVWLAEGVVLVATSKFLIKFLTAQNGRAEIPAWLQFAAGVLTSDAVVISTSGLVFVFAMISGITQQPAAASAEGGSSAE